MKTSAGTLATSGDRFLVLPYGESRKQANTPPSRHMTLQEAVQLAFNTTSTSALPATRSRRNSTRRRSRRAHRCCSN
jgi:hypothetical protein